VIARAASSPSERVIGEVSSWEGVETAPHRFGGLELRLGRRELGHLHGDRFADIPLPRRLRDRLVAEGRARPHHVLPDSGWVTVPMDGDGGAETVAEILRLGYERATAQRERRRARDAAAPAGEEKRAAPRR